MSPERWVIPALVRDSLLAPRRAAAWLLGRETPLAQVLQGLALVAALGGLLLGLLGGGEAAIPLGAGELVLSPVGYALLLAVVLSLAAVAIALAGRALGGTGTVRQALTVVVWLQVVDLAVQAALTMALLLIPAFAGAVALAGLVVLAWCLVNFVLVLHGFAGLGRTVGSLILALIGLGLGLSVVIEGLGLGGLASV